MKFLKVLSVFLSFLMVFSSLNIVGYADQKVKYVSCSYENPVLKDENEENYHTVYTEYVQGNRNAGSLSFVDSCAVTVRDAMINREKQVELSFNTTRTDFSDFVKEIVFKALSEELNIGSDGGDYLRWNFSYYQAQASVVYGSYGNIKYDVTLNFDYYTTKEQENRLNDELSRVLSSLDLDNKSDFEKYKIIYDYICEICEYDEIHEDQYKLKHTAYAALMNGIAVCQGYSCLFYKMCKNAGLENRIITSLDHSWNIVKIGDIYYNTDPTWDDNYYEQGQQYKYFLKCKTHFNGHNSTADYDTGYYTVKCPMAVNCYDGCTATAYHIHNYTLTKSIPVSCDTSGYDEYDCKCGSNVRINDSKPAGHYYSTTLNKASLDKAGSKITKCSKCSAVKSKTNIPKVSKISLGKTIGVYNGYKQKPTVSVVNSNGEKLRQGTDYDVQWVTGFIYVGKHKVKITLKGNYTGAYYRYYTIKPSPTSLISLSSRSKSFVAKWNRKSNQVTGYQLQYSAYSNFKSPKTVTIKSNKTVSKTVKNIKSKKKYYVRVRTYKTVNGTNYYSSWSAKKAVTTK